MTGPTRRGLTARGWGVALTGLVAAAGTPATGYSALALWAVVCLGALAAAVPVVWRPPSITARTGRFAPEVARGSVAALPIIVTPAGRGAARRATGMTLTIQVGDQRFQCPVPAVRGAAASTSAAASTDTVVSTGEVAGSELVLSLIPRRRGEHWIDAPLITRQDVLGLCRCERVTGERTGLTVLPAVHGLPWMERLGGDDGERLWSRFRPYGDAFHTLRGYQWGDDTRCIHWPSSARAGTVLVRQTVSENDVRLLVVLDQRPDVYVHPAADFEEAVDAAASVVAAHRAADRIELRTTGGLRVRSRAGHTALLRRLADLPPLGGASPRVAASRSLGSRHAGGNDPGGKDAGGRHAKDHDLIAVLAGRGPGPSGAAGALVLVTGRGEIGQGRLQEIALTRFRRVVVIQVGTATGTAATAAGTGAGAATAEIVPLGPPGVTPVLVVTADTAAGLSTLVPLSAAAETRGW
ncbi:putative DUF58 domain-containing protein [Frankia sp. Hr75.2]|nr:putative DUF58 domain-containing protein [Frankia sp. Hr75.2]